MAFRALLERLTKMHVFIQTVRKVEYHSTLCADLRNAAKMSIGISSMNWSPTTDHNGAVHGTTAGVLDLLAALTILICSLWSPHPCGSLLLPRRRR